MSVKLSEMDTNKFSFLIENETITASVSPCSWAYPNYGLQVVFESLLEGSLSFGSSITLNNKTPYRDSLYQDVVDFSKTIKFGKCQNKDCNRINFINTVYLRENLCQHCLVNEVNNKYNKTLIEEINQDIKEATTQLSLGNIYFSNIVMHTDEGDDEILSIFSNKKNIKSFLASLKKQYNTQHVDFKTSLTIDYLTDLKDQIICIDKESLQYKITKF